MKGLKRFIFLLAFVFVLPLFGLGCGELKFEDVPYEASTATNAEANTAIVNARNQFKSLGIKSKIQTTNLYKFYPLKEEDKYYEIKDVITTHLCVEEYGSTATVSKVEIVRYKNDTEISKQLKTYVDSTSDYTDYCYTLTEKHIFEDGKKKETETTRDRSYYDSGRYSYATLFDSAFVDSKVEEIDFVYTKSFEGTTYYKFESNLLGLIAVNERFQKYEDIASNPSLFVSVNPDRDTVKPFSYEYGINGNGYLVHAKVNYNITNEFGVKYLAVESVSNISAYGDSVSTLKTPDDVDDYTAETFVSTLKNENSYVTYRNTTDSAYTKTIVGKLDDSTHPDYTIKVENYQSNSLTETKYYYVKYELIQQQDLEGEQEGEYQAYLLDVQKKEFYKVEDYVLEFLKFDLNLDFNTSRNQTSINAKEYQYGSNTNCFKVMVVANEVSSMVTETSAGKTEIFIESYGNDFTKTNLNLVESLLGYTEKVVEENPEGGESGGSGESSGEGSGESGGTGESNNPGESI